MREATPIRFRLLREGARLPQRATPASGAFDLYAPEEGMLVPGQTKLIGLGIAHEIPENLDMEFREDEAEVQPGEQPQFLKIQFHGLIIARSGLSVKHNVKPFFEGLIDHDYRGEIKLLLWNGGQHTFVWAAGERLAQIAYLPFFMGRVVEATDELTTTVRGDGGFGSTGR